MACGGPFSPVMTIAASGFLPGAANSVGAALGPAAALTNALGSYNSLPVAGQFNNLVASAANLLSPGTLTNLQTLAANVFPALTNAIPAGFSSALVPLAPGGIFNGGFSGLLNQTATGIMGSGDLSKFAQIFNAAQGFLGQSNQLLNSALNIDNLAATFGPLTGGMDNLITGSVNQVSEAFGAFGQDLRATGNLFNMGNLVNLGDPSALVKQLADVGGLVPGVENALREAGLDSSELNNLAGGQLVDISDSANRLLYQALTQVTGSDLAQVKSILGVTTPGIQNMAQLLDPAKILPNSHTTLTMPTPDGLRGVYLSANTVNTNLEKFLQDPNAPEYTGDDPIVRARLGLPPLETQV